MSTTASAPGLQLVQTGLDALRDEAVAGLPGVVLGEQVATIETFIARLRHEQARRAVAFESAGGPLADGFSTAAAWIRANTPASPGEARDLVSVGRAVRDRLPASGAVLASGGMSFTAATAITRALRDVRDPEVLAEADRTLSIYAPTMYPSQIAHAARRVLEYLDPELAQSDAAQRWADRTLSLAPMLDGSLSVSGQLDEVSGAVLLTALTPMMTPRGPADVRTIGQRRVDALVELVGKAAEIGAAGTMTSTGLPPTLLVKVDIERLRDVLGPDFAFADSQPTPRNPTGDPAPDVADHVPHALGSNSNGKPRPGPHEPDDDLRTDQADNASDSTTNDPTDNAPDSAANDPTVSPTDNLSDGAAGPNWAGGKGAQSAGHTRGRMGPCPHDPGRPPPPAELDWGGPILDETLRRIGCSAQLIRLVTSGPNRVLNLGRARRLASPAQNLARMARDGGCLFTGCDLPPEWTEAHHEKPWGRGGNTDLEDLLSFCAFHHHLLQEGGWTLRRTHLGIEIISPNGTVHGLILGTAAAA
ncbi:MAG: putative endonuclease [Jatrophihabitantaceae bacterium]|nr:putative endonuclease [Jatrophihabitantaceae bacterium]